MEKHYDPYATLADVEVLLNVSNGTARRRLAEMRKDLGIPSNRVRLRLSAVCAYFRKTMGNDL